MRRLLAVLAVAGAMATLASCGGDTASPLDEALGYLPEDAPFAVAISTDLEGSQYEALGDIAERFPFTGSIREQLQESIEEQGEVDFGRDIRPLLGNDFVVGAPDAASFTQGGESRDFVLAFQVEDQDKLEELIERQGAREVGEESGATLYQPEGDDEPFAVADDVLVAARSRELLEQALAQREADDRLTEETFDEALEGLPEDALVRVYADVQAILEGDPDAREARKIQWVAALRTLGLTASVEREEVALDFNLRTESGELGDGDLPIAAGEEAPEVVQRPGELNFALRDPSQILEFAQTAGRSVDPAGFGDFQTAKRQIEERLGVNIDEDIVDQLTGDVSVNVDLDGRFGVRAELEDPAAFERTLSQLAGTLPEVAESLGAGTVGLAEPGPGEDFYALAQPEGDTVVFGVVDEVLVVSNDPGRAGRLSTERPESVPDADGAIVMSADAEELANRIIARLGGFGAIGGAFVTGPLGNLTASSSASPEGLTGRVTLGID